MKEKREMIKELTNSAWSILSKYENDERNGLMTRSDAQKTAISRIQYLRYGNEFKDYFWITDLHPNMIMHPYRTDLNGKDLTNFTDPHGKKLFVECVKKVKESEHGYVDYMWQWKDNVNTIVPKLSYVQIFEPWGWVIGTGVYIEDVEKETKELTGKLLWISLAISGLIAFLLLFITSQSLKAERKRINAEKELHESQEKFKTLVEAATEGLIMISDGKISYLNSIFCKMTGFEYNDLINHSLIELISENNNEDTFNIFSKDFVPEGSYDINLKKKNNGFIEVLVTSTIANLYNKTVNVIIVKDITLNRSSVMSDLDYQKLIGLQNIGFFRVKMDNKLKFIFANDTAIRIFGYDNFIELSETCLLNILVHEEDRSNLRNTILEKGFIKNKILKIRKHNGTFAMVSVTLVVFDDDENSKSICDATIIDITDLEYEKSEKNKLIAALKSSNFQMEQTVKSFQTPIHTIDSDATINQAVKLLSKKKTDCLLVTKNDKEFIGIVTNADIQKRVLSLDLHLENPIYLIMSSPVIYISENTLLGDAITFSEEKRINHLVVRNDANESYGVLRLNDIYKQLKESLSFLFVDVQNSETKKALAQCYKKMQMLIKPLLNSDISIDYITKITSSFSDAVMRRIIQITIDDIGEPPVKFSFISMGSEGRKEETLFTDQDNAIIYEDIPKEKEKLVTTYFNRFSEKICDELNFVGYSYCQGKIMATNPKWCQPYSVWKKYFSNWVTTPEAQNLLEATIFFDFRNVYGDEELTDNLRATINYLIKDHPLFIYHLAHNTYNIKPAQITSGHLITEKNAEYVDLKNAVNFIVMFARTYALQNRISFTNTLDRLNTLKNEHIVSTETIDEIIFVYNFLMKLRFRNQMDLIDNNLPLSNILYTKNLLDVEVTILKKLLALVPAYQDKIAIDFRITT